MTAPDAEEVEQQPPQGALTDTTCDESEEQEPEPTWEDVKQKLRLETTRMHHMLKLFESQYTIASPVDAFSYIKEFLGVYMVADFDLAAFRESLGESHLAAGRCLDDAYLKGAGSDLAAASEVMMRLAATIARAYGLRMDDWADINKACSEGVRIVPACYHLRTRLPAALDSARAMRFLVDESADAAVMEASENAEAGAEAEKVKAADATNPWKSLNGQLLFDQTHSLKWSQVELLSSHDDAITCCFSGAFQIVSFSEIEETGIVLVSLDAVRIGAPPCGFKEKEVEAGDSIFWEVEKGLAPALLEGVVVEGDWYETKNELCFLGALNHVAPAWILT